MLKVQVERQDISLRLFKVRASTPHRLQYSSIRSPTASPSPPPPDVKGRSIQILRFQYTFAPSSFRHRPSARHLRSANVEILQHTSSGAQKARPAHRQSISCVTPPDRHVLQGPGTGIQAQVLRHASKTPPPAFLTTDTSSRLHVPYSRFSKGALSSHRSQYFAK
ncbi:hypothetical protein BC835DRAFT_721069 [Cytidiella melzeri]|nr:hypothetical protein BC835DRAFT_721069 [Cytidiella melzeri]